MTLHNRPRAVQHAAVHLLASAGLRTKEAGDPLDVLSRKFGDHTAEVMRKLGASNDELKSMGERVERHTSELLELHQKLARPAGGGQSEPETLGQQFVANPGLKAFADQQGQKGRFGMRMKATITTGSTSAGAMVAPKRDDLLPLPKRRLTIRDLMPVVNVTTGAVEYPRLLTRPDQAAPVAEGTPKPESSMTLDLVQTQMKVIAHWIPASRQILDDAPQLKGLIDTELMYGLKLKEEEQLLFGSGTGQNLLGMVTSATAYAAPFNMPTPNMIDQVGLAILQTALTDLEPDGVVLSSADWMRMRLLKNADGEYLLGKPGEAVAPVLFGLPVVATPSMTIDKFLVGAFQAAGTIYDRWEARVEVSTEHADFFTRNLVAILCEERIGVAIKRPTALTYGDFGNVT